MWTAECGRAKTRIPITARADFPFIPSDIKALLITHAHIDHTGMVPLLVKRGFNGPIFSTEATAKLCGIMLPDSAHIQEQDAEYQNRKNGAGRQAPCRASLYRSGRRKLPQAL